MVVNTLHLQAANAFYDHQLVIGLGSRILVQAVEATTEEDAKDLFSSQGSGLEVGVLYRPERQPFRLGFAAREAIETTPRFKRDLLPDDTGDITIPSGDKVLYLPERASKASSPRWHGTLGLDVRLIRWSVFGLWPDDYLWRLGVNADVSQRYAIGGLSLGGWYPRLAKSPF